MPSVPVAPIFHVLPREEWQAARRAGRYTGSTRGRTLAEVGYVHCCFDHQVEAVADRLYPGHPDLVVLVVDPARLAAEVRVERLGGAADAYPHVYGPLELAAVTGVVAHRRSPGAGRRE